MNERRLLCIVEGDGERIAVPTLVNRILKHLRREKRISVDAERILCTGGVGRITAEYDAQRKCGVEFFVGLAARHKPAGILVLLDADDACLERAEKGLPPLGQHLLQRAQPIAGGIPVSVVVANRMFEAWFLADFHSLRSRAHLPQGTRFPQWRTLEAIRGCKGWMKDLLGRPYAERHDQPRFAQIISLPLRPAMQARSRSYWKLFREVDRLSRPGRPQLFAEP